MVNGHRERPGTNLFIDENLEQKVVGILSVVWPPSVQQILFRLREKHQMWDEIKWSSASRKKVPLYLDIVEKFFLNSNWGRLNIVDITTTVEAAIRHGIRRIEYHCSPFHAIFIDNHTTPKGYVFERQLKDDFGCNCVLRLDNKSTDMLQLCDLMMNLAVKSRSPESVESPHKRIILDRFIELTAQQSYPKIFCLDESRFGK